MQGLIENKAIFISSLLSPSFLPFFFYIYERFVMNKQTKPEDPNILRNYVTNLYYLYSSIFRMW